MARLQVSNFWCITTSSVRTSRGMAGSNLRYEYKKKFNIPTKCPSQSARVSVQWGHVTSSCLIILFTWSTTSSVLNFPLPLWRLQLPWTRGSRSENPYFRGHQGLYLQAHSRRVSTCRRFHTVCTDISDRVWHSYLGAIATFWVSNCLKHKQISEMTWLSMWKR